MKPRLLALLTGLAIAAPALAQDIRGLEICTAEKAMDRRTSCLQSNVEFLQQELAKQTQAMQAKLAEVSREIALQKAELVALKAALAKLQLELADMKKLKPDKK